MRGAEGGGMRRGRHACGERRNDQTWSHIPAIILHSAEASWEPRWSDPEHISHIPYTPSTQILTHTCLNVSFLSFAG